jgi:diguanylate cyclase (GGDEF)-like protein
MSTILVVDDRAFNREYLTTLLGYDGHTILEAADGEEALSVVREHRPDLIITDIAMPRMDGVEFVKQVQREPGTEAVPVIFYSATYRVPKARELARGCRAAAVLPKPSEPEVILSAVRAALDAPRQPGADGQSPSGLNPALVALMDFQCELAGIQDAGTALELACRAAPNLIPAEYCALGVDEPRGGALGKVIARGLDPAKTFSAGANVSEAFAAMVSNRSRRRAWNPDGTPGHLGLPKTHPPVRSLLAVPLAGVSSSHGWIYLANRSGGLAFSTADEELLALLARQAATAYENDLYAERALRDTLTGLNNRRGLGTALEREVERAARQLTPLALVIADLDHFKQCNDRYGHDGGDVVLRAVGTYLKLAVRGYDQVYRFGGEEFVILLPGATTEAAVQRVEQIRNGIKALDLSHEGRAFGRFTMSFGLAVFPDHGRSGAMLLRAADQALYAAKHGGRDQTCVAPARKGG